MAAIAFLAFVAGGWTVLAKVFPGTVIHDAYRAAGAAWKKNTGYVNPFTQTDHWRPARTLYRGVTVDPAAQADPGYTLYTTGDSARAVLVSVTGRIVWQWQMPYSKVWNRHAAVKNPRPDRLIFWTRARVFPDGNLLAIYEAAGDTPWGYGMVKLNRDSQVLWGYRQHTHHNFDIGPDGRIYALINNFTSKIIPKFDFLARTRLDDSLVILSADGKQIDQISLTRALADGPYRRLLSAVPVFSIADPLHTNSVQVITAALAAHFPFAHPGDVLLSFRDIGAIAVLDPRQRKIVWALRGSWYGQHDARLLPDGHILMFDNFGNFETTGHGRSRALEIDPVTQRVVWSWSGDRAHPLDSEIRGAVEREPDGDTLITDSDGGHIVEVTPQGEVAWEYYNPVRVDDPGNRPFAADSISKTRDPVHANHPRQYIPVVGYAQRIGSGTLDPDFRAQLKQRLLAQNP